MPDKIAFLPIEELAPTFCISQLSETQDWGMLTADISLAHNLATGKGITVAVLDTGGPNHNDLTGNLLPALNTSDAPSADDYQGHGTHVAGIIGALQNGIGIVGVAPDAKILPIKVLDDTGHSGFESIIRGLDLATANKVDIISMSLGASFEPPAELLFAIRRAVAQGIIVFAAAGNDSGAVNWPARYDEVIAVAAIDNSGNLANFSSRGEQIAVGAPGVSIYSTWLNNQFALLSGTSQATPFIAGITALLLDWSRNTPGARVIHGYLDVLAVLDEMCDHQGRIGVKGRSGATGFGIPRIANIQNFGK